MAITIPEWAGPPEHPLRGLASSSDTGDENLAEFHNRSWPLRPTMVPLPPSGGTVTVLRTTVPSGPFPWPRRTNHGEPPHKTDYPWVQSPHLTMVDDHALGR